MSAAGLADDAVEHGDFTEASGERAAARALDRHPDIDGFVVASDLMAAGALQVLAEPVAGCPTTSRSSGFDDLGVAERTDPAADHRAPAGRGDGRAGDPAAARARRRPTGGHPMRVIIPPTLVRRASA